MKDADRFRVNSWPLWPRLSRGAWPASIASCQRGAHKRHRSPGFRPGKP